MDLNIHVECAFNVASVEFKSGKVCCVRTHTQTHTHAQILQMIPRSGLVGCVFVHWAGISVRIKSSVWETEKEEQTELLEIKMKDCGQDRGRNRSEAPLVPDCLQDDYLSHLNQKKNNN